MEEILRVLVNEAATRAEFQGAKIDVAAIAAIRSTREATVHDKQGDLHCIAGTPEKNEKIGNDIFDGIAEAAIFPGDLPQDPNAALRGLAMGKLRFVKFRPPVLNGETFPHIRLDRALEFLIGDRFP